VSIVAAPRQPARESSPKAPTALPTWSGYLFGAAGGAWDRVTGRPALVNPYSARTLAARYQVSGKKAQRELGFSPRPLEQTLRDAWQWLQTDAASPLRRAGSARRSGAAGGSPPQPPEAISPAKP
jgi:hypothetical protein